MHALFRLRRIARYHERLAKIELAVAEHERADQERAVAQASAAIAAVLDAPAVDATEHHQRHGYALRMEMARRGAERRLIDRQKDVGTRRDAMAVAMRERGTLDRLVEIHDNEVTGERQRVEQHGLDETGLQGWWRRG